ncbi:MAG: glucosaminidase domain-containing protein [Paraburkholderia fungorum]|nr:glucosaminidase domain-containing protein [Paraburkholderia fungorum]
MVTMMLLSDIFAAIFGLFRKSSDSIAPAPAEPLNVGGDIVPTLPMVQSDPPPMPAVKPAADEPVAAPAVPAGDAVAASAPMTPAQFVAAISPAAQACMRRTGVPASVTVAQAALESSWGKRAPGMNLFGIKADASWRGPVTSQVTHEVVDGKTVTITANFRAYSDWQGSIDDHAAFLTGNPRYRPAFACKSGPAFAKAIAAAGYATDPLYADKLISIMSARNLNALDS